MLAGSVSGDGLAALLRSLQELRRLDLRALAERIATLVEEGHREGLLAGTDAQGRPMAPLAESTVRNRRRGDGPPTVPHRESSRLIRGFSCRVEIRGDRVRVVGTMEGVPFAEYLQSGTSRMAARPWRGIRPETAAKIQVALDEFAKETAERVGL